MILALAVAVVALGIRVLVAEFQPVIQPDGVVYLAVAKQFQATGSPFDPLFHPLYPMCIALAQPLIGNYWPTIPLISGRIRLAQLKPIFANQKLPKYTPQADRDYVIAF